MISLSITSVQSSPLFLRIIFFIFGFSFTGFSAVRTLLFLPFLSSCNRPAFQGVSRNGACILPRPHHPCQELFPKIAHFFRFFLSFFSQSRLCVSSNICTPVSFSRNEPYRAENTCSCAVSCRQGSVPLPRPQTLCTSTRGTGPFSGHILLYTHQSSCESTVF